MKTRRTTLKDLENAERAVNNLTEKVNVKVSRRYNYIAIDLYDKNGACLDTLVAGLTKREALTVLEAIKGVLVREKL